MSKTSKQRPSKPIEYRDIIETYFQVVVYELKQSNGQHGWVVGQFPKREDAETAAEALKKAVKPYDIRKGLTWQEIEALEAQGWDYLRIHEQREKEMNEWRVAPDPFVIGKRVENAPIGCPREALEAAGFEIVREQKMTRTVRVDY